MFAVSKLVKIVIQYQQPDRATSFWKIHKHNRANVIPRIFILKRDYIKLAERLLLQNNSPNQTEFILGVYTQLNNTKSINVQQQL